MSNFSTIDSYATLDVLWCEEGGNRKRTEGRRKETKGENVKLSESFIVQRIQNIPCVSPIIPWVDVPQDPKKTARWRPFGVSRISDNLQNLQNKRH